MRLSNKVRTALDTVIQAFRDGTVPEKIALATFPMPDIPSAHWSMNNRILALIQTGDMDCRGYRQWHKVGRNVKKVMKASFILRPAVVKEIDETGEETSRLVGFSATPVFSSAQTEGTPLAYQDIQLPRLPLAEVARAWGVTVTGQGMSGSYLGYWSERENKIVLNSPEISVFTHELCHAAHSRLGLAKAGQDPMGEIVAELGAEVLRRLLGDTRDTSGNAYAYVEMYAKRQNKSVLDACLQALNETAQVVELIIEEAARCDRYPTLRGEAVAAS